MTNQKQNIDFNNKTIARKSVVYFSAALIALLVCILIAFYYAGVLRPKSNDLERFKTGNLERLIIDKSQPLAPNDSFLSPEGKQINLSNFRGHYVLVNVWASWCAPCIREMPSLAAVAREFEPKGLKVVAINIDGLDKSKMASEKLKALTSDTLAFYRDPQMRIAYPLKAKGLPVSVIFDKQGKEIARIDGAVEWEKEEAQDLINEIIK